jgi:hypothetical protein
MKMKMKMKKTAVLLAFVLASPVAFAGGPVSTLPVQTQLHQEAITISNTTAMLNHGTPLTKMTPRVERIDFALQNTAAQMHVKAPFAHMANKLPTKPTRAELLGNLKVAGQWVKTEKTQSADLKK